MMLVGRFIKLAVMMGLVSQLFMSAYMTSMTLQRQGLEAAQSRFYTTISALGEKVNKEFSLCLNGQSSDDTLEDCDVCKALVGFGVYTLAALPVILPTWARHEAVLPVSLTARAQDTLRSSYIRGPPTKA